MPVVVSFVGQKGGVGKSTLARAFAAIAARGKLKVKLADLDVNQQTSVRWARTRSARGNGYPVEAEAYTTFDDVLANINGFDLIIVDTPGHASPVTLDIARSSQVVILPTGASTDDLYPTVLLLYELEQMGIPKERLAVALCRLLEQREEHAARKYIETRSAASSSSVRSMRLENISRPQVTKRWSDRYRSAPAIVARTI